jgi:hypothetical protein
LFAFKINTQLGAWVMLLSITSFTTSTIGIFTISISSELSG